MTDPAGARVASEESRAYYESAVRQVENMNLRAAVIELKNALQRDPQNAEARLLLGQVYERLGDGAAAEKELRAAERMGIHKGKIAVSLGRALLLQGHYDAILNELDPVAFGPGMTLELSLQRAEAQVGLERLTQAYDSFEAIAEAYPDDARAFLGMSQLDLGTRRFDAAETKAKAALDRSPQLGEAFLVRAEVRRLRGDVEASLPFFHDAIENQGQRSGVDVRARLGLASALIALNRDAEAKAELETVRAIAPNVPLASYLQALILVRAQEFGAARQILDGSALSLESFVPAQFLFGVAYYAVEEFETARSWLIRHLAAQPQNLQARKLLGAALLRLNDVPEATELLEVGLAQAPEDPQVLMLLGNAYLRIGRPTEATQLLERVATLAPEDPRVLNQLAITHLATGEYDSSLAALSASLDLDAGASTLGYALAFVHLRSGAFDEALKVAQELRTRFPESAVAANLEGGAYAALGDLTQARKSFEAVLEIEPGFHQARANLAALKATDGDVDGAEADYRRILDDDPMNVKALLGMAGVSSLRRDKAESRRWLERAVAANPDDPQPAIALANGMASEGEVEAAIGVLDELARRQPRSPQVLAQLGQMQFGTGRNEAAVDTYRRLVEASGGSAEAGLLLARAQVAAGKAREALQTLEATLARHPDHTQTADALVRLASQVEGPEGALTYVERLQRRYPNEAWPHQMQGHLNQNLGRQSEAIAAYERAWRKRPTAGVAIALSRVRLGQGDTQAAMAPLREWLAEHEADDRTRLALAETLISLGELEQAQAEYEKLFQTQEANPIVWNNLAWLYQQAGDPRAVEHGEQALRLAPDQPAIMDTLGWILLDAGQVDRATDLLRQAHESVPDAADIAFHYAVALHKGGDSIAARDVLKPLLNSGQSFASRSEAEALLKQIGG